MINNRISGRQFFYMVSLYLLGSTLVLGTSSQAGQDAWLADLFGALLALPIVLACARILQLFPGKNLFEIVIILFGNVFGKLIIALYIVYFFQLGGGVLRTISEFIQVTNMPETPQIMVLSVFTLLCIWLVKSGIETMGRVARIAFIIMAASIGITILLSLKDMNFSNIKPVFGADLSTLTDSATTVFAIPFAEIVLFTIVFPSVEDGQSPYKLFTGSLACAAGIITAVTLRNLFILGVPSLQMSLFPSYDAVSIISVGEFFTRVEVLIGMNLVLAGFMKTCVNIYVASSGIALLFNLKDDRPMAAPIGAVFMTLATIMFSSSIEISDWLDVYKYFALPFQVILPLLILAVAELRTRLGKLSSNGKTD